MFYNVPMRRAAMRGAGEEYSQILRVVQVSSYTAILDYTTIIHYTTIPYS